VGYNKYALQILVYEKGQTTLEMGRIYGFDRIRPSAGKTSFIALALAIAPVSRCDCWKPEAAPRYSLSSIIKSAREAVPATMAALGWSTLNAHARAATRLLP
jgi:hypothetical protein